MLGDSDNLAPALFRAILDVFPVLGPLLAPFESPTASKADLGLKTVLGLWGWTHDSSLIRPTDWELYKPSKVDGHQQHHNSTNKVDPLRLRPEDESDLPRSALTTKHCY
jgi:hypothetical protein